MKLRNLLSLTVCFASLLLASCSSFNTAVFNAENLAADSATAGVRSFNLYYAAATNGASTNIIAELDRKKDDVYAASRAFSATLSVLDQARLAYVSSGSDTNKTQVEIFLTAASSQSSNLTWLVTQYLNSNFYGRSTTRTNQN